MFPKIKLTFLTCALLFLIGCTTSSVRHLARLPVIQNQEQSLSTRYWNFRFSAVQDLAGEHLSITGQALPVPENLPAWGNWARTLNLAAYLCDEQGTVLAEQTLPYPPRPVTADIPVPFAFTLDLPGGNNMPLALSFGYSMEVVPRASSSALKNSESGVEEVFYASQKALLQ